MGKLSILATMSIMANVVSFATLIWRIYHTQNTSTYSWLYLSGILFSQILMIIYGFVNNAPEIYAPTLLLFFGLIYIFYNKYMYGHLYNKQQKIKG